MSESSQATKDVVTPSQLDCILQLGQLHGSVGEKTYVPSGFDAWQAAQGQPALLCFGTAAKELQKAGSNSVCMSYQLTCAAGGRSVGLLNGLEAKAISLQATSAARATTGPKSDLDLRTLRVQWLAEEAKLPDMLQAGLSGKELVSMSKGCATSSARPMLAVLQGTVDAGKDGLQMLHQSQRLCAPGSHLREGDLVESAMWGILHTAAVEMPAFASQGTSNGPHHGGSDRGACLDLTSPDNGLGQYSGQILTRWRESYSQVPMLQQSTSVPELAEGPYGLLPKARGSLAAGLVRIPRATEPSWENVPPGYSWVCVKAVGINFRDVLNVLGMYPGDPGPPGSLRCFSIRFRTCTIRHYASAGQVLLLQDLNQSAVAPHRRGRLFGSDFAPRPGFVLATGGFCVWISHGLPRKPCSGTGCGHGKDAAKSIVRRSSSLPNGFRHCGLRVENGSQYSA